MATTYRTLLDPALDPQLTADLKSSPNRQLEISREGRTPILYQLCEVAGKDRILVVTGSWMAKSTVVMLVRDGLISI